MQKNHEYKNNRKWNFFSVKESNAWKKFFHLFKTVITPRFLYEVIIPQDILNVVKDIKFPSSNSSKNDEPIDPNVIRFILACSIFNGVLIGMPGAVGLGVLAAQAVEVLMAVQIAKMVGLLKFSIFSFKEILKFFSAAALAAMSVVYFFKKALDFIFNISGTFIPAGYASFAAALITTLFYGLFLYLCFIEIKGFERRSTKNSIISLSLIPRILKNTSAYTVQISKSVFKLFFKDAPRLFSEVVQNVRDACNGVVNVKGRVKGEIFLVGCLAHLLDGQHDRLQGPFAYLWLQAWREALPSKLSPDSSIEEIAAQANTYHQAELENVIDNNITPKFFEILETTHANADGDIWSSERMESQNHPISDAVFFNSETGQTYEVNYKFSENEDYIENHIQLHPDVPVVTTADVAEKINSPLVFGGNYNYDEIIEISEQNFEQILEQKHSIYLELSAIGTGAIVLALHTSPFLVAFYRGKITRSQLGKALKKFIPEITGRTINRIAMLSFLGPVYGTFLIASFVGKTALFGFEEYDNDLRPDERPEQTNPKTDTDGKKTSHFKKKFSRRGLITLSFLNDIN